MRKADTEAALTFAQGQMEKLGKAKDIAYSERNLMLAILVSFMREDGMNVGLAAHADLAGEEWEPEWRTVVIADLPTGQISFHIHDNQKVWFADVPPYNGVWDGHTTVEKYERMVEYAMKMQDWRKACLDDEDGLGCGH